MIKLYEEPDNGFVGIHYDHDLQGYVMHMDCKDWIEGEDFKECKDCIEGKDCNH